MMSPIKWILVTLTVAGLSHAQTFSTKTLISDTLVLAKRITVIDLDADGDMDIVATANDTSATPGRLVWFENDGSQQFTEHLVSNSVLGARSVYVADLNEDGFPDILAGGDGRQALSWFASDGTPADGGWTQNTLGAADSTIYSIHVTDFDGDQRPEVISSYYNITNDLGGDKIRWFKNNGSGSFTENSLITNYEAAASVWSGDINGDAEEDIISVAAGNADINNTERDLSWWANDGSESFTQNTISPISNGPWFVIATDLDKDNDLDILLALWGADNIAWYENNGSGSFAAEANLVTSFRNARNVFAADIDADGDIDLAGAADDDNTIAWFQNDGTQNFSQINISTTFTYAYFALPQDLDGDGDIDIIATAQNANELSWWVNSLAEKQWIPASSTATYSYNGGKADITFSTKDISDSTSVLFNHGAVPDRSAVDPAINHVAANGFYTIVTAAGTYNATIDFTYAGISEWSAINNEADLRICVWNEATSQWEIAGTGSQTIDALNDVITVSGLSKELARFSRFTLGSVSTDNALPVELAAFTLTSSASGIELFWSTESERDNLGFEVWRKSAVEQDFVKISDYNDNGDLAGLGTSSYGQEYYLMDTDVETGRRYSYQLRSRDYDGSLNVYPAKDIVYTGNTPVVTVSGLIPQTPELSQNFPNPFNGITRIDFAVPVEEAGQNVSLAVYDIRGRLIRYLIDSPLVEGRYFALWDGRNQQGAEVSSGMYIYLLQVGKTRLSKRLTLLK